MHLSSDSAHPTTSRDRSATQPVVCTTLRGARHSDATGRKARELAWQWVASKWPRLMPNSADRMIGRFARHLPGQRLVASVGPGRSDWTLAVAFDERLGSRTWITQIDITDRGDADILSLRTACTRRPDAPAIIAPPSLLGTWVERLALQDGPFAVLGEPREVRDEAQLQAFITHVLSPNRRLPLIALTSRPHSRHFGVDPQGLATSVRGLAHVVCVAPNIAAGVAQRLGSQLGVVPGAARIYRAAAGTVTAAHAHPLLRATPDNAGPGGAKGAFRRSLCQTICAWSVQEQAERRPESAGSE